MTIWDGYPRAPAQDRSGHDIDGKTEPVYPMNVQGVATQYTITAPPCTMTATRSHPTGTRTSRAASRPPPNRYFALLAPANTSRVVLNDTAQTVTFRWAAAVDLNGDNVIYQWLPIGFPQSPRATAAHDTFLVRTGKQLLTYLVDVGFCRFCDGRSPSRIRQTRQSAATTR